MNTLRTQSVKRFPPAVVAAAVVLLVLPAACRRSDRSPGDATPTHGASAPAAVLPAFWPVGTAEEARALQQRVDAGEEPWRRDPRAVAEAFVRDRLEWSIRVEGEPEVTGTAGAGWTASVRFRPLIGEAEPPSHPGPLHTIELVGLQGVTDPVWFVAELRSEDIVLDQPAAGAEVTSPLHAEGRGRAYEETIHAEIRDDAGTQLNAGAGIEAVLQGGAMEPAPFSGDLAFDPAGTPAGTLALLGDTGAGPVPAATIVRIRFS